MQIKVEKCPILGTKGFKATITQKNRKFILTFRKINRIHLKIFIVYSHMKKNDILKIENILLSR